MGGGMTRFRSLDMVHPTMAQSTNYLETRRLRIERLCYCPKLVPLNDNGVVHCTPGEPLPLSDCEECPLLLLDEDIPARLRKRRDQAASAAEPSDQRNSNDVSDDDDDADAADEIDSVDEEEDGDSDVGEIIAIDDSVDDDDDGIERFNSPDSIDYDSDSYS